jgi:hypothetical protein
VTRDCHAFARRLPSAPNVPLSSPVRRISIALALSAVLAGCVGTRIPDPKEAAAAYAEAAKKGDADALYGMLSKKGQRTLTRDEVKTIVKDEKAELADQAKALSLPSATIKSEAKVKFADGEEADLSVEKDGYKITSADALPSAAKTPAQSLGEFRRCLARRSYACVVRVLAPATRAAMEDHVRSLVDGLENPQGLDIQVTGDTAIVSLPGGHQVHLRRDAGTWHIEDFD